MKTAVWDGSVQEFWDAVAKHRAGDEIESDAAVLSEVLLCAQALRKMVVYAEELEAKHAALLQATGALVKAARAVLKADECDIDYDLHTTLDEALKPFEKNHV